MFLMVFFQPCPSCDLLWSWTVGSNFWKGGSDFLCHYKVRYFTSISYQLCLNSIFFQRCGPSAMTWPGSRSRHVCHHQAHSPAPGLHHESLIMKTTAGLGLLSPKPAVVFMISNIFCNIFPAHNIAATIPQPRFQYLLHYLYESFRHRRIETMSE